MQRGVGGGRIRGVGIDIIHPKWPEHGTQKRERSMPPSLCCCRRRRRDGDKKKNKRISGKTETNEKNERVRSAIAAGSGRFVMRIMGFKSALRSRDV